MALVKCKECGEKVSKKAKACPSCGSPIKKKSSLPALLVLLLILGWIGSKLAPPSGSNPSSSAPSVTQQKTSTPASSGQREKVQRLFQGSEEPTAKDALWTTDSIFKVGVLDDGTSRDGYASYVCQVLYDYGFKGQKVWVQVIDIAKLTQSNKWVKLGEARCQ